VKELRLREITDYLRDTQFLGKKPLFKVRVTVPRAPLPSLQKEVSHLRTVQRVAAPWLSSSVSFSANASG
jgi:hypothetical protein